MKGLVDKTTIEIVGKLINDNHHGEAYGYLAHTLGLTEVAAKLKKVCEIHNIAGHLENNLYEYRYDLIQQVHKEAQENWNWKDIQGAL